MLDRRSRSLNLETDLLLAAVDLGGSSGAILRLGFLRDGLKLARFEQLYLRGGW